MRLSRVQKRLLLISLLLFMGSLALFLINIGSPTTHSFDEFHYVPSAKQFLTFQTNQNWEHPPLGKMLMAVGIWLFGDEPLGWRFMSAVFGSLTLVGMTLWAYALFASEEAALWVAAVTLGDQLLYVQARIGMLDTFMMGFLSFGLAAFTASWDSSLDRKWSLRYLRWTGVFFGLAVACKWFAVMPLFGAIAVIAGVRLLQHWGVQFANDLPPSPSPASRKATKNAPKAVSVDVQAWYSPELWKNLTWLDLAISLGLIPFVVYYLSFLPTYAIDGRWPGLFDFLALQLKMYDGQLRVVNSHPYMSTWKDWPLITRPIWYAFDHEADPNYVRGVLLIGNPLVMWGGLAALVGCVWDLVMRRSRDTMIILFAYAVLYGSWVVIPRKISFYYYYYPAGLSLGLALAVVFCRGSSRSLVREPGTPILRWIFLGAVFAFFIYFLPILAGERILGESFRKWMWFPSWI